MTEVELTCAIADYLGGALPKDIAWSHIGHGEERPRAAGKRLKRMGVQPGVSDFIIFSNPLLCLEVKTERGRLSPAQKEFGDKVFKQDHWFKVVRSVDDVAMVLRHAGVAARARVSA